MVGLLVTHDWFEMGCHLSPSPGVGKLFIWRAALTILRARACCLVQLHAIEEIALAHNFAKSSGSVVSQRAKSVVSLKKKRSSPFCRR